MTTPSGTTTYGYDSYGNVTSIYSSTLNATETLSYDANERLSSVTTWNGSTVNITYNADGQRASYSVTAAGQSQPQLVEQFSYDQGQISQVTTSGTNYPQPYTDTIFYRSDGAPAELIRQQNGTTSYFWYATDAQHNVVAVIDSTRYLQDYYRYDAWGQVDSSISYENAPVPQRLRYGGYWYDEELGWYWLNARVYDPVLERFLQPDPSQQEGTLSYVYVGDDPLNRTDPSGLDGDELESNGTIGGAPSLSAGGGDNCAFMEGGFCYTNTDAAFLTGNAVGGDNPSNPYSGIADQVQSTFSSSSTEADTSASSDGSSIIAPDRSLGNDPATGKFRQNEYDTAVRIQQERGVTLRRDPSGATEWFDADGRSYDAVGGFDAAYFGQQWPHLQDVIRDHLTKADFVPVDVGRFTPTQVAEVEQFITQHGLEPRVFVVRK